MANWHRGMPLYVKVGCRSDSQLRQLLISLYKKMGQPAIAKRLGVHLSAVFKAFKRLKIKARSYADGNLIRIVRNANLTRIQLEILDGLLLGDGHLTRRSLMTSYHQSCKHESVLQEVSSLLGLQSSIKRRADKPQEICLRTLAYLDLSRVWGRWYKPIGQRQKGYRIGRKRFCRGRPQRGKKIIPRDIRLTPTTCYWWHISDGSAGKTQIRLFTNGFTKTETRSLRSRLARTLGLSVREIRMYSCIVGQWALALRAKAANAFLVYIGPCHTPCYQYKWDRQRHSSSKRRTLPITAFCICK